MNVSDKVSTQAQVVSVVSDMTRISVLVLILLEQARARGPNVVLILADDLGVNDVR